MRALRAELRAHAEDAIPSYNDMIVKACAFALRDFPHANGSSTDGRFELHGRINVGVAVAAGVRAAGSDRLRRRRSLAGRDRSGDAGVG